MNRLASIVLKHGDNRIIDDVELWLPSDVKNKYRISDTYRRLPMCINYRMIPLHLISMKPTAVFSDNPSTEEYFLTNLVRLSLNNNNNGMSLVFQDENGVYLLIYYEVKQNQIKCMLMDFTITKKLSRIIESNPSIEKLNTSAFLDITESAISKNVNTLIFDKVLSQKRQNSNPFLPHQKPSTTSLSSATLSTNEQISLSVNKMILSGLRIRGLSTNLNHSVNDKLTIKEIYQMTYKSTMFSLRKFNYGFNNSKNYSIKLNDIQDIVEKLLQIFIDMDDVSTNSTPKIK